MKNLTSQIAKRYAYRTRKDIEDWRQALAANDSDYCPRTYLLQDLYDNVTDDALLTSQIQNRQEPVMSRRYELVDAGGNVNEKATATLQGLPVVQDLIKAMLDSELYGYTLLELVPERAGSVSLSVIPRQNVVPVEGRFYPDIYGNSFVQYRDIREYGRTILEFYSGHRGLLNKTVPHVLFKKFAQSCWSELCEIYGIPPRFLKTDTQDPEMLARAEQLLKEMGSAAAMVIDSNEELNFATGVSTSGEVYQNLINLCNNEISMVISGAIIGQDTAHGNYSKEQANQDIQQRLIESDSRMVEAYFNTIVLPALSHIGAVAADNLRFRFCASEDLADLWDKTVAVMPYYDIDPKWIKEKFGVEVTAKRADNPQLAIGSSPDSFFL
jgi:phage gp29-like protein